MQPVFFERRWEAGLVPADGKCPSSKKQAVRNISEPFYNFMLAIHATRTAAFQRDIADEASPPSDGPGRQLPSLAGISYPYRS